MGFKFPLEKLCRILQPQNFNEFLPIISLRDIIFSEDRPMNFQVASSFLLRGTCQTFVTMKSFLTKLEKFSLSIASYHSEFDEGKQICVL